MAKLTLSAEPEVIAEAKRLAKESGTSVSAMFERMIRARAAKRKKPEIGPLTRQISGLIRLPPDADYREILTDALLEKYGLK